MGFPLWKIMLFFICAAALLLTCSPTAFAINEDYLEPGKWHNNPNVTYEELERHSIGYTLNGVFGYYADESLCLYTNFAVSEDSMEGDENDVRIVFNYRIEGDEYRFSVSSEGICDEMSEEVFEQFEVKQHFLPNENSGNYLAAVQYRGKAAACEADITLYINGHNYIITKGLYYELPTTEKPTATEKPTTTKQERTTTEKAAKATTEKPTKATTEKTTKETTTVRPPATAKATAAATTKATTAPTTKFTPAYLYTTKPDVEESAQTESTTAAEATATVPETVTTAKATTTVKETTTKFVPTNPVTTSAAAQESTAVAAAVTEEESQSTATLQEQILVREVLPPAAKRNLLIAAAAVLLGLLLLALAARKSKHEDTASSQDNNDKGVS